MYSKKMEKEMETERKKTRSGSKWYRLPQQKLNTAITDDLFRTQEPEATHSPGERRDSLSFSTG